MLENIANTIGESKLQGKPKKPLYPVTLTKYVREGDETQEEINTGFRREDIELWNAIRSLPQSIQRDIINLITNPMDQKYKNITSELYDMIASLQVGGIALSNQFGNRTDIGITQKTLTNAIGGIFDILEEMTGKKYMDYTLTVVPSSVFKEGEATINITADCTEAISNFDSIKIYIDNVLVAESSELKVFHTVATITQTSVVKAEGVILGRTIEKSTTVLKEIPFFIGSGMNYKSVMVPENLKPLIGTLEGDYDVVVKNNNEYIFIIIPISKRDEFRRADMNGLGLIVEIPMEATVMEDYVVYKSLNTYKAGTYNIDIDINS